ncbi:hypothetical protein [Aquabacterium sp.]|uniref:hypothetical protein n=1 Tax=Aquabacterium sp. TaxID=1872578 RepID=UPI002BC0A74C|nr:hypothetical protein [Aquabacterium sp.]HSW08726.1 hypothetical protein [Aquabacterium sp.]
MTRPLPWRSSTSRGVQDWRGAGWFVLACGAVGLALLCCIPLASRLSLLRHADGYLRTTMTVQSVTAARGSGVRRYSAQGRLPDGTTASIAIAPLADRPLRTLAELEAFTGQQPVVLDVMVNEAYAGNWLRSYRVRLYDPLLRQHEAVNVLKLLMLIGVSIGVAALAVQRCRCRR